MRDRLVTRSPLNGFSRVNRSAERRQYGVVDWLRQFEKLCVGQAYLVRVWGQFYALEGVGDCSKNLKLEWGKRNTG